MSKQSCADECLERLKKACETLRGLADIKDKSGIIITSQYLRWLADELETPLEKK